MKTPLFNRANGSLEPVDGLKFFPVAADEFAQ